MVEPPSIEMYTGAGYNTIVLNRTVERIIKIEIDLAEELFYAGVAERTNAAGSRPVVPLEHLGSNPNPGV